MVSRGLRPWWYALCRCTHASIVGVVVNAGILVLVGVVLGFAGSRCLCFEHVVVEAGCTGHSRHCAAALA